MYRRKGNKWKGKKCIISKILSYGGLSDEEIEQYVNDYIYGDRVTFTLWTFGSKLEASDYEIIKKLENRRRRKNSWQMKI